MSMASPTALPSEGFHLLQPQWLWLLPVMLWLLWQLRRREGDSPWQRVCDPHLLARLLPAVAAQSSRRGWGLLVAGWLIALAALADPVWERLPQPLFRQHYARVLVLDLSASMASTDLSPSRLERAKQKVRDLLAASKGKQIALVAFAGEGFIVSPLTDDGATVESLQIGRAHV